LRQVAAIFLILLLSFHWYGYRFIIKQFQQIADQKMERRLDISDYNETELIEIRTPLNMPYQNSSTDFERCYGEIVIGGVVHTYVKRKVENGVLVLQCIPNHEKQAIKKAGVYFFQENNGIGIEHDQKPGNPIVKVSKNAFGDCENQSQDFILVVFSSSRPAIFTRTPGIQTVNIPVAGQPPDAIA
jgi:hypothetical protein